MLSAAMRRAAKYGGVPSGVAGPSVAMSGNAIQGKDRSLIATVLLLHGLQSGLD